MDSLGGMHICNSDATICRGDGAEEREICYLLHYPFPLKPTNTDTAAASAVAPRVEETSARQWSEMNPAARCCIHYCLMLEDQQRLLQVPSILRKCFFFVLKKRHLLQILQNLLDGAVSMHDIVGLFNSDPVQVHIVATGEAAEEFELRISPVGEGELVVHAKVRSLDEIALSVAVQFEGNFLAAIHLYEEVVARKRLNRNISIPQSRNEYTYCIAVFCENDIHAIHDG